MSGEYSDQEISRQLEDVEADFRLIDKNKLRVLGRQILIALITAYGTTAREIRMIAPADITDKPAGSLDA
jgi:hypothetical protein